jgi:hypothetical protein
MFSARALSTPIVWIHSRTNHTCERRIRPIANTTYMTVLDRIEMNIVAVALEIGFVPQRVLPEAPLPDAPFAFGHTAVRRALARRHRARECTLDEPPPRREIRIAIRKRPDGVEMIRQDHDGIESEGVILLDITKGAAQSSDMIDQQSCPAIGEIDGEEIATAAAKVTPIFCHHGTVRKIE